MTRKRFRLVIGLESAAFEDYGQSQEIARILQDAASKVVKGNTSGKLLDLNGNTVGQYRIRKEALK